MASISVIIPVYNAERYLAEAIRSVLDQEYPDLEILVVDDGSTDRSLQIANSFLETRCLSQSNAGPAAARNLGLQNARGSVLAFLDADDLWPAGRLKVMLEHFQANPSYDIVSGYMQWVGEKVWKPSGDPDFLASAFLTFGFGCSLIRRAAYDRVGPLNPDYRRGEDTEWFMRARETQLRIRIIEGVVLYYRRHDRNLTLDAKPVAGLTLQILKDSLNRRRQKNAGQVQPLCPLDMNQKTSVKR